MASDLLRKLHEFTARAEAARTRADAETDPLKKAGLRGMERHFQRLACGLAAATRRPVITSDVMADPGWQKWQWLATAFNYRGCWSFPIETRAGAIVGTFAMYHVNPCDVSERDLELASFLTSVAAGFIERRSAFRSNG